MSETPLSSAASYVGRTDEEPVPQLPTISGRTNPDGNVRRVSGSAYAQHSPSALDVSAIGEPASRGSPRKRTTVAQDSLPDLTARSGAATLRSQRSDDNDRTPEARATYSSRSSPMASTYSRTVSQTAKERKANDDGLTVNRFVPTSRVAPWNSNMDDVSTCPKEELPRIDTHRKNKYDYLSEGISLVEAGKPPSSSRASVKGSVSARSNSPQKASAFTPRGEEAPGSTKQYSARSGGGEHAFLMATSNGTVSSRGLPSRPVETAAPVRGAAAVSAAGHDAALSSVTTGSSKRSSKVVATGGRSHQLQHWSEEGYKSKLLDMLDGIDFSQSAEDLAQLDTAEVTEGEHLLRCLQFVQTVAEDQASLTAEDIHGLLLMFTPTGVFLQEAVDFLWDECDRRTRLTLRDFTRYGIRLRERLADYDHFAALDDRMRLLEMYARVYPNDPLPENEVETARQRLAALAGDAVDAASTDAKHLRVYEILFLADYHEGLYRRGFLSSEQVADVVRAGAAVACGDLRADLQRFRRELGDEMGGAMVEAGTQTADDNVEELLWAAREAAADRDGANTTPGRWSDGSNERQRSGEVYQTYPLATGTESDGAAVAADEHGSGGRSASAAHRAQPRAPRKPSPRKSRGRTSPAQRSPSKYRKAAGTQGTAAAPAAGSFALSPYDPLYTSSATTVIRYQPTTRSTSRQRRPSFNLERQLPPSTVKYLGRSATDDYADRAEQDTRLIHLLQANYL